MTKEEKAKAYDKAIETAKDKYAKFKGMLPGNVLEDVFPELKDNEDEKTRKEIIAFLLQSFGREKDNYENDKYSRWFAWLEKQKSVDLDDINVRKMVDNYSFTDEYDEKGNCKGRPINCEIEAYKKGIKDILKIVKQNVVKWSEEDKNTLKVGIELLEHENSDIGIMFRMWLKSLLKRFCNN